MSDPYIAELKVVSFNYAPKGWALCNGQLLPIAQNQGLFSLLGTTYGGDGRVNFALPNLQGRAAMHVGQGFVQGQAGGEVTHTLTVAELAAHTHPLTASSDAASVGTTAGDYFAVTGGAAYAASADTALANESVGSVGGSLPHENMSPYLVLNVVIALQGIFPTRN
jgi:microcystin-dependent protein